MGWKARSLTLDCEDLTPPAPPIPTRFVTRVHNVGSLLGLWAESGVRPTITATILAVAGRLAGQGHGNQRQQPCPQQPRGEKRENPP